MEVDPVEAMVADVKKKGVRLFTSFNLCDFILIVLTGKGAVKICQRVVRIMV